MTSSTEDLRVELGYLRDNVVEAASQGRSGIVEGGLETYHVLVETFIEVLKEFGSPYGREQALAEIHSLGGGWSEIEWVRDDYREIANAALASKNLSVLVPVLYFPVRLSTLAFSQGDYYIFAQFLNWLPYLYEAAVQEFAPDAASDLPTRENPLLGIVRDRLSAYARELVDYRITPSIEEAEEAASVTRSCEFARGTYGVFNRLLKAAYDLRRSEDFQHFASELQDVRQPLAERAHLLALEPTAERADGEESEPASAEHARAECCARLARLRQVVFLGLEAWLLRDFANGNLSVEETRSFKGAMHLPSSIPELWRLYVEARRERYENELEWSWWQSREHRSRRATYAGIDFGMLLLTPVLLRMLTTASSSSHAQIQAMSLDLTPDLEYLVSGGSGPLIQTLEHVAASAELQELSDFQPDAAIWLRERFVSLAREQADDERQRVIAAPISSARVTDLKDNILRGWREGGYLRDLVRHRGNYELAGDPPSDLGSLSVHLWERKDVLVDGSRFSTHGWGIEYGRSLAQGEDELFVDQVVTAALAATSVPVNPTDLVGHLDQALDASTAPPDPVIILVGSLSASRALADSSRYRYAQHVPFHEKRAGEPFPGGYFNDVPTYQMHSDTRSVAIVADLRQLGTWRQYRPKRRSDLSEYLADVILFEVETYTEADARVLLSSQPDTLRFDEQPEEDRRERSIDERIALVLQRVRLLALEQFEFKVMAPAAARVIPLAG